MGLFRAADKIFVKMDKSYILLISLFLVAIIGVIDYITGYEVGFYIFYLFPVSFAVWYADIASGTIVSFLSALTWLAIDIISREKFQFSIVIWNASIRMCTFLVVSYGLWHIRSKRKKERDLVDFIVHDLRLPLAVVKESIDLTMETAAKKLNKEEIDLLSAGQTSCRRAMTLINSILDLARLEAGKMPIESGSIEIHGLTGAAIKEVGIFARRSHVILEEKNESNITDIESDRQLLFRILVNLLTNAIKASHPDSTVTLEVVSGSTGYLTFNIKDQGPGIALGAQKALFKKFTQLEVQKKGIEFGSGIGLNFAKIATEALGGSVVFKSEAGKGAQVSVNIPVKMRRAD